MTTPAAGGAPAPDHLGGILLICLAVLCFAFLDAGAKYLSQTYPVAQVVWARYATNLFLMVVILGPRLRTDLVRTGRLGMQVARSVLLLGATAFMFTAIKFIPLAEATTIGFVNPLLLTALSVPLLKERVGVSRWLAVVAGFVGVLVVLRPGFGVMHWAAVLPLGMALCLAFYQILTRKLAATERPVTTLFYSALVGTIITSVGAPAFWQPPTPVAWLIMMGLGLIAGTGHFLLIKAYGRASASLLAPFGYVQLIWVTTVGYLVFGALPDVWTVVGASIIVGSGLLVIHRERRAARHRPARRT